LKWLKVIGTFLALRDQNSRIISGGGKNTFHTFSKSENARSKNKSRKVLPFKDLKKLSY
jgi:hypothetical protein